MSNVNLSLDDIISTQKGRVRGPRRKPVGDRPIGGKPGGNRRTSFRREKYFSDDVPSGKWKHDKFFDVYGGGNKKNTSGVSGRAKRVFRGDGGGGGGGGGNQVVKLNISNLPESVVTADLEELFQDFDVLGVTVHYDETGAHLGTADLFTSPTSARSILREYADIAIDGQAIKIGIVDESGSIKSGIKDRIRRVGGVKASVQRVRGGTRAGPRRRAAGGRVVKGEKKTNSKLKKMTAEELDKELEAYMGDRQGKE